MPLLGFGVYKNFTTKDSCLEAFKAGYRYVDDCHLCILSSWSRALGMWILHRPIETRLPLGLPFENLDWHELNYSSVRSFKLSLHITWLITLCIVLCSWVATKCATKSHGYESTLKGVDDSLARFQFGANVSSLSTTPSDYFHADVWY